MKIRVTAKTRAKKEYIKKLAESEYIVSVVAVPTKGKANLAIIRSLARHFGCSQSEVVLMSGAASKKKVFMIDAPSVEL